MQIRCPFCRHDIVVKGAKAGLFQPKCPACRNAYVLAIPTDRHGKVLTAKSLEHLRAYHAGLSGKSQVLEAIQEPEEETAAPTAPPRAAGAAVATPVSAAAHAGADATVAAPPPRRVAPLPGADGATVAQPPPRPVAPAPPPSDATIAAPPPPPPPAPESPGEESPPLGRLGGYQLLRLLGRGGMGEVFLARQLSLDRFVALKTIHPQWGSDPLFLSRFTREAFAAAQLNHHNVVQIHDIGEDGDTHFFSMEYVEGQSLDELAKARGRLEVDEAVSHVLQAARGLKYAHDHGMVHRDVKPANLMLSTQGVVKVADLGLVKRRGSDTASPASAGASPSRPADVALTAPDAIGTPQYMPPEQAKNAATVDARADIYSLGATLYRLVTGRPLFEGTTVEELLQKHARERPTPPEQVNPAVPKQLSLIILTMVAKRPEDRYASLDECIASLEAFLTQSRGALTPDERDARILEAAADGYSAAGAFRARLVVMALCLVLFLGVAAAGLLLDLPWMTAAGLGAALLAPLADALVLGLTGRGPLFSRVRQMIFTARWADWLMTAAAIAAVVVFVVAMGLHWLYLGVLAGAVALAAVLHFTLDRAAARQREPQLEAARGVIKAMRLHGVDESDVRRFIARFSGENWEPLVEALFGYEAMLAARHDQHDTSHHAHARAHAAWRDPIIRWLDERLDRRRRERQLRHLRAVEERRLRAEGKTDEQAKAQAQREATKLVEHAGEFHQRSARGAAMVVAQMLGKPPPRSHRDLDDDDDIPDSWQLQRTDVRTSVRYLLVGPKARLVLGGALLIVAALWVARNGLPEPGPGATIWQTINAFAADRGMLVDLPFLPRAVERVLCSPGAIVAGLLLLVSGLYRGSSMTWLLLPALLILLLGPSIVPPWGGTDPALLTAILGLVLGVIALRLGSRS